jgi:hypothetical protein
MSIGSTILAFLREVDVMFDHARTGQPPLPRRKGSEGGVSVRNVDGWANNQARSVVSRNQR